MAVPYARRVIVGFGAALLVVASSATRAQRALEYEVKAAFLYNFVHFIEWPAETLGEPSDPFKVCLYGRDPFGAVLDRTFAAEQVQRHPIQIVRLTGDADLSRCRMLFDGVADASDRARVLRAAAAPGQLTIGESAHFIEEGGGINFLVVAGRVRFDVNPAVLQARRLKVSAKLLQLAHNLERGRP
jgi:YfiR/HmsC-like